MLAHATFLKGNQPEPSLSYILNAQRSFSSGLPDSAILVANMNSWKKRIKMERTVAHLLIIRRSHRSIWRISKKVKLQ